MLGLNPGIFLGFLYTKKSKVLIMKKLSKRELKSIGGGCGVIINPPMNCDEYCDIQRKYSGVEICYNNPQIPLSCETSCQ